MLRQKHHQKVTAYEVLVGSGNRPSGHRRCCTAIRLRHVLTGFGIDKTAVEQAIQLSEEKYCSVGAMLETKRRHLNGCVRDSRGTLELAPVNTQSRAGLRLEASDESRMDLKLGRNVCLRCDSVCCSGPAGARARKGCGSNAHVRAGGAYGAATESGVSNERRRSRGNASKAETSAVRMGIRDSTFTRTSHAEITRCMCLGPS